MFTIAARCWQLLVAESDPLPPWLAVEWCRDEEYTDDLPAILAALRGAAADWVEELWFEDIGVWDWTPHQVQMAIRNGRTAVPQAEGRYPWKVDEAIKAILTWEVRYVRNRSPNWLAWCDRAEKAIAILKQT